MVAREGSREDEIYWLRAWGVDPQDDWCWTKALDKMELAERDNILLANQQLNEEADFLESEKEQYNDLEWQEHVEKSMRATKIYKQ